MTDVPVIHQITTILETLSPEQQTRVLRYTRNVARPQGIVGADLVQRAIEADFDPEDLAEMLAAIEADCEKIDESTIFPNLNHQYG